MWNLLDKVSSVVTLVVVCYNGVKWLEPCLQSITNLRYPHFEVILVDNASEDLSVQYVKEHFPLVRVIKNRMNLGYTSACNIGANNAKGEIIAFLNQDLKVDPYWLSFLILPFKQDEVGACLGRVLSYDMDKSTTIEDDFYDLSTHVRKTKMVTGVAFVTRKNVIEKISLFDPRFFMYYE